MVNLHPFATDLHGWLQQKPVDLVLFTPGSLSIENPYTQHVSYLIGIFAEVVNDFIDFTKKRDPDLSEPHYVDLKRMRFASEMILYAVRICEALFKQLLYCTNFDPRRYRRAALGGLLSARCNACWKQKKVSHMVSLAGSLFHRYEHCGQYEECLSKDLQYLNQLRNKQAAHATVASTTSSPNLDHAWSVADWYCLEIGNKFAHMLSHIAEIEQAMMKEAALRLITENRNGTYNSNLTSTYYWQIELEKLHVLLRWKATQSEMT